MQRGFLVLTLVHILDLRCVVRFYVSNSAVFYFFPYKERLNHTGAHRITHSLSLSETHTHPSMWGCVHVYRCVVRPLPGCLPGAKFLPSPSSLTSVLTILFLDNNPSTQPTHPHFSRLISASSWTCTSFSLRDRKGARHHLGHSPSAPWPPDSVHLPQPTLLPLLEAPQEICLPPRDTGWV